MTRAHLDGVFLTLGGLLLIAAFFAAGLSREIFMTYFGAEDSLTEDATALFLVLAGLVLLHRIVQARHSVSKSALVLGILYGLIYIWAGGEEISWGQRIIGFESPEYFMENNDQSEFTFHNLVIGDVKLDELLFGPALSLVILTYLIVLPFLWLKAEWVRRVTRAMVIPVPRPHHAVYALAVTLIIPLLAYSRRWEVYECVFALLSLAIFINPVNPLRHETPAS